MYILINFYTSLLFFIFISLTLSCRPPGFSLFFLTFFFSFLQYLKIPADREKEEDYEILEENIRYNRYNNQVSNIFKINR